MSGGGFVAPAALNGYLSTRRPKCVRRQSLIRRTCMSCTARHLASLTPYDCGRILAAVLQLVLFILLAASVCSAQPSRTNPFHNSAADIDTGRATFRIYCAPCHGIGAAGGSGPDLTLGVYEVGDSDEDLFEVIKDGVNGTEMSGFGERMNDNTIWRVVAYLRSVARKETPVLTGDASRGESIYQGKGGCAGCHRIAWHRRTAWAEPEPHRPDPQFRKAAGSARRAEQEHRQGVRHDHRGRARWRSRPRTPDEH